MTDPPPPGRLALGETAAGAPLTLPLDAATQTIAILARRGQGKTYLARGLAEEMGRCGVQFVVLDPVDHWWGLRTAGDGRGAGLAVYLFGGRHADLPLEETAGAVLADTVVDTGISAICCTRQLSQAGKRRFVADFCERIYQRKGAQARKAPLHLFLEESQEYAPQRLQKGDERMFGAVRRLVRLGRGDGFGISLLSQRPQSINKEVLTQCELLICFQVTHKLDRRALDDWVEAQDTAGHREAFMAGLAGLQRGEGWVWSPAWLQCFERVRFRTNRTYDSSATPAVDAAPVAAPVPPALDLDFLRARIAETVERAAANDPQALRREIARLERELAARPAAAPERIVQEIAVPVLPPATQARLEELCAQGRALSQELQDVARAIEAGLAKAARPAPRRVARAADRGKRPPPAPADAPAGLKKGARRMLATLVAFAPRPLTRQQLGTLAVIQPAGGTFSSYLSDLRRGGWVAEQDGALRPTAAGIALDGHSAPAIGTTAELVAAYQARLKAGARRMFEALLTIYPDGYTREALGQAAGIEAGGGTFSSYLSDLRRNQLIHEADGLVRVSETLYLFADE